MPTKPHVRKDIDSVSKFDSLKYFTDKELQAYTTSGADKAKMAVFTTKDGAQVTLIFAQAEDAQAAYSAAKELNAIQVHNGRKQDPDHPNGVRVAQLKGDPDADPKELAGIRAHYSHGRVIARVDVSGKTLDDIRQDFNTVLAGELKVLSPDA